MSDSIIGWSREKIAPSIKQGETGTVAVTFDVTKPDGSALDSYDGWTCRVELYRTRQGQPEITLTPTVVGDIDAKTLSVALEFDADTTEDLNPGALFGDLLLAHSDGTEHRPLDITLTIERAYTKEAA
jgi:hypothetical protein